MDRSEAVSLVTTVDVGDAAHVTSRLAGDRIG
jgi:hypothetical protein